jgi:uncharacterized protein
MRSLLAAVLLLPVAASAQARSPAVRAGFVEMDVRRVAAIEGSPAVLLQPHDGEDVVLPIFIGENEANAIRMRMEKQTPIRPLTHDLLEKMIRTLGGRVLKIEVDDLRDNIYLGTIYVQQGEKTMTLDARPSDSIALALGTGAPIYAARKVIDSAGVKGSGAPVDSGGRKRPTRRGEPQGI